jgi:hypothetical protein
MNYKILWPVLAVLAIGLVAIFYPRRATEPPPPPELPAPAPVEAPAEPPFFGPEPEPEPPPPFVEEPLAEDEPPPPPPPIEEREPEARAALAEVAGPEMVDRLVREDLVRRLVATVDNLAGEAIWINARVLPPQEGVFLAEGTEDELYISPENYRRYAPLVQLVDAIDTQELAEAYARYYPLLQQAYEELGYPGRQFHYRALEVIDHLLETPVPEAPVRLEQPHVLYEFADPQLEALSSGQKALLRLGPQQGETVRRKLVEFRAAIEELGAASDAG